MLTLRLLEGIKMKHWSETVKEVQKEPVDVFYKKGCSKHFHNTRRKTPMLQSIFNKVTGQAISRIFIYKVNSKFPKR